jgi:hypothetical protein
MGPARGKAVGPLVGGGRRQVGRRPRWPRGGRGGGRPPSLFALPPSSAAAPLACALDPVAAPLEAPQLPQVVPKGQRKVAVAACGAPRGGARPAWGRAPRRRAPPGGLQPVQQGASTPAPGSPRLEHAQAPRAGASALKRAARMRLAERPQNGAPLACGVGHARVPVAACDGPQRHPGGDVSVCVQRRHAELRGRHGGGGGRAVWVRTSKAQGGARTDSAGAQPVLARRLADAALAARTFARPSRLRPARRCACAPMRSRRCASLFPQTPAP